MNKKAQNNALIALFLIVLGAIVVAFMLTKDTDPVDNIEVEEHIDAGPTQNFNFLMPEAWSYSENAVKDIQTLTPGQVISFGIVPSKNDEGVYYFVTEAPDPKNDKQELWSFYQYNNDYTFERVYRLSLGDNKGLAGIREGATIDLHAVAHDDYKLIILAQDADSSPGPCTEVLTLGRDEDDDVYEMLSLDLLNPYHSGLQPYEVPDDVYQEALERQNKCVSNL